MADAPESQRDALERSVASVHAAVQRRAHEPAPTDAREIHAIARQGVTGAGGGLPYRDRIQQAFGRHDVSGVRSFSGDAATHANERLGAHAFAMGDAVAFRGAPSLFTAAHEAAHVVQQRAGVRLQDGVGRVGDRYERHADEVASAVIAGRSAESILDRHAGGVGGSAGGGAVQLEADAAAEPSAEKRWTYKEGDRVAGKASAGLATDFTPETFATWKKDANTELDKAERWIREETRSLFGASAPNKVKLDVDLALKAGVAGAEKKSDGKGTEVKGAGFGIEAAFKGAVGWSVTLDDILKICEKPDLLKLDREFSVGGEKGRVKGEVNGELFVGVTVDAKVEVGTGESVGAFLEKATRLIGGKVGQAAKKSRDETATAVESSTKKSDAPVPKIEGANAGAEKKSEGVTLGELSASGSAFAGASLKVGGKLALGWKKKKPEAYTAALEHFVTVALAVNPATMAFAVPVGALFALKPDLMAGVAPAIMGQEGDVDVAAVEGSVTGTAGAGIKGAFKAELKNGKVAFKAAAEGTVGFGGGGEVDVTVDPLEALRFGAAAQGGLLTEVTGAVKQQAGALAAKAQDLWTDIVKRLANNVELLKAFVSKLGDDAGKLIMSLWDALVAAGANVKTLVEVAWGAAKDGMSMAGDILAKAGSDAASLLEGLWDRVKSSTSDISRLATTVVDKASAQVPKLLELLWTQSWEVLGAVWGSAGETLRASLFTFVKEKGWGPLGSLLAKASGNVRALIDLIWDASRMEDLAAVFETAKERWDDLWKVVWDKATMEQLGRMVGKVTRDLDKWAKALFEKANIEQLVRFVRAMAGNVWEFIKAIASHLSLGDMMRLRP